MRQLYQTDVLVVGGGMAGVGAALAAARAGKETMLVEKHGFFGGVGAMCMGMPINQMRTRHQPRSAIHEALIESLAAYGDKAVWIGEHQLRCNVEYLKVAILDALDAAGCRYLVHAHVVDSLVTGDRVSGVVMGSADGLLTIQAEVVIDCSGDGDVAHFAGAEMLKDMDKPAPLTLVQKVGNVDMAAAKNFQQDDGIRQLIDRAREKYPLIPERWRLTRSPTSTSFHINHGGTKHLANYDATDPVQLSEAECQSRRQAVQMIDAMREFGGEALAGIEMIATGPQVGVRPRRRVKGLYVLTEEDAMEGRRADDTVAWRSGFLDIGFVRFEPMKIHDVPYGALVPEKIDGLLMAGRCVSATHVGASAGKSMGNCMATGHAAGIAAALAMDQGKQPRELDVGDIQARLRKDGVDLNRAGEAQEEISHIRGE